MAETRWRRLGRWVRAGVALAFAVFVGVYSLVGAGFFAIQGCADACGGSGWRGDPDAWPWRAQFVVAAVASGAMVVGAIALFRREPGRAPVIYGAGLVVWAVWLWWLLWML